MIPLKQHRSSETNILASSLITPQMTRRVDGSLSNFEDYVSQRLEFEFHYKTASEIIEDSLDVVNIVRRVHWLEAFAKFVLGGQRLSPSKMDSQALLTNHAVYLLCKDKLHPSTRPPPDNIQNLKSSSDGLQANPCQILSSESGRISSELCQEFLCFLSSRTQQEGVDKVKLESARDNLGKEEAASPLASVAPVGFLQKVQKVAIPSSTLVDVHKSAQGEGEVGVPKSKLKPRPGLKSILQAPKLSAK